MSNLVTQVHASRDSLLLPISVVVATGGLTHTPRWLVELVRLTRMQKRWARELGK